MNILLEFSEYVKTCTKKNVQIPHIFYTNYHTMHSDWQLGGILFFLKSL